MPERMFYRPDEGSDRSAGPGRSRARSGAILLGAKGSSGVHEASQIMTILVMYTKACIRTGVKSRRQAPKTARSPLGRR